MWHVCMGLCIFCMVAVCCCFLQTTYTNLASDLRFRRFLLLGLYMNMRTYKSALSEDIIIGRSEDINKQRMIQNYIFKIASRSLGDRWLKLLLYPHGKKKLTCSQMSNSPRNLQQCTYLTRMTNELPELVLYILGWTSYIKSVFPKSQRGMLLSSLYDKRTRLVSTIARDKYLSHGYTEAPSRCVI